MKTETIVHPFPDYLNQQTPIESIIGRTIIIKPRSLINDKRLYATQNWIDLVKLSRALVGTDLEELPISGYVADEIIRGRLVRTLTVAEGHHRIGVAALSKKESQFFVLGCYCYDRRRYGFNLITGKIIDQVGCQNL